jgi:hypothetical protein
MALEFSLAISSVNVESNAVLESSSVSVIRVSVRNDQTRSYVKIYIYISVSLGSAPSLLAHCMTRGWSQVVWSLFLLWVWCHVA